MNRLKKELAKRGVIYDYDAYRSGIEEGRELISATEKFIVTFWWSSVLPPMLHIFDRNFNMIAEQNVMPEPKLFEEGKTWGSYVF